mgnify:CR=1 FL=1
MVDTQQNRIDHTEQAKIISADRAKKLTDEEIKKDISDLLPIMSNIEAAIKRKEHYITVNGILKDYTKQKLIDLGYKIEFSNGGSTQRDPDYYIISWNKA